MAKKDLNLDNLFKEHFESLELETSANLNSRMLKKLKHFKAMLLLKKIALIIAIASTAITITYLSMQDNKTNVTEPEANPTEKIISEKSEKTEDNTSRSLKNAKTENSQAKTTKKSAKKIDKSILPEEKEQIKEPAEATANIISAEKASYIEAEKENTALVNTNNSDPYTFLEEEKWSENSDQIKEDFETVYLSQNAFKKEFLTYEIEGDVSFKKYGMRLKPINWHKKRKKIKSSDNNYLDNKEPYLNSNPYDGFLEVHFTPLLWSNSIQQKEPVLEAGWTHNLVYKPQLSYEFGVSFQLHKDNSPLFLQIGADYQVLKDKADFKQSLTFEDPELSYWDYDTTYINQEVMDTFYIIVDGNEFVIDTLFTQIEIIDDIDSTYFPVLSTEEKNKSHVNTYRFLNIPLLLGYKFKTRNDKWNFHVQLGAAIAINLENKGYYYNNKGEYLSFDSRLTPNLNWNAYAAASAQYQLSDKFDLFLQPEFQYQLNKTEITNQPYQRRYQFYKMKFGIRYKLFK